MAHYHAPLDLECPIVHRFMETLFSDPMTKASGAPIDEIVESFERKHIQTCLNCKTYGLVHLEVSF